MKGNKEALLILKRRLGPCVVLILCCVLFALVAPSAEAVQNRTEAYPGTGERSPAAAVMSFERGPFNREGPEIIRVSAGMQPGAAPDMNGAPVPPAVDGTLPPPPTADGTLPVPPTVDGTLPPPPTADGTLPVPPTVNGELPPPPTADGTFPVPPTANGVLPLSPNADGTLPSPPPMDGGMQTLPGIGGGNLPPPPNQPTGTDNTVNVGPTEVTVEEAVILVVNFLILVCGLVFACLYHRKMKSF